MALSRRRFNQTLLGGMAAALSPSVFANLVEGTDWRSIARPQRTLPEGQIGLTMFFSYGCPFCGQMHRAMGGWVANLPEDVVFQRVPVSFNREAWAMLSRLYFALEATGDAERLSHEIYDALSVRREPLFDEAQITAWVTARGVDATAFRQAFQASQTSSLVARSDRLQTRFEVRSVPTLVVDGRYAVVGQGATSYQELFDIADQLITKARS